MEYKEYLEERMSKVYEAYESTILEEFKRDKDEKEKGEVDIRKYKKTFINYLEFKYEDKTIRYEIADAKTDEEKEAIVKKYSKDFEEWRKRQNRLKGIFVADLLSIAGVASGAISNPVGNVIALLLWGGVIKTFADDGKARNNARYEKYKENKKEGK